MPKSFQAMNEADKEMERFGVFLSYRALNPITLPEEDAEMIKQAVTAIMRDPTMAAAAVGGNLQ